MPGDYVKRSDTLQAVGDIHPLDYNGQGIVERIKAIPAADVVEVVHGRPVKFYCDARTGRMMTTCSACDMKISPYDRFCKHCGAKMDGGMDNG